jgi:hypothetical protein
MRASYPNASTVSEAIMINQFIRTELEEAEKEGSKNLESDFLCSGSVI